MKTNFNYQSHHGNKNSKGTGYSPQKLTLSEAIIWFLLTALALFLLGSASG